jgi:cytochrome c-type biogenesis protein CcmH/NrfG
MLSDLLLFPITGPLRGVEWLARKIKDQVDEELYSEKSLRKQLYALNEQLDKGEITEEEFEAAEAVLLEQLERAEAERRDESNE